MCGITGWVDFGRDLRGEGERAAIEAMTATMICRGPDAGGTWCSAHAAIGHRRLSVTSSRREGTSSGPARTRKCCSMATWNGARTACGG
jgi:asparagine synthase (glutamine-hydrolysing)